MREGKPKTLKIEVTKKASKAVIPRLYNRAGEPCENFNQVILRWLDNSTKIIGHSPTATFTPLRTAYCEQLQTLLTEQGLSRWQAHRTLLTNLTDLLFGIDIATEIGSRLTSESINVRGFRSALAQGVAKNTGENFTNIIVHALADALSFQDEVLVDKGLPPLLKKAMVMYKPFVAANGTTENLEIKIEGDLCIFSRSNPGNAIVVSAKTRLKEIFHIAVMWKLLLDMLDDDYSRNKWGLTLPATPATDAGAISSLNLDNLQYVFATADMISKEGKNTQGCDVERTKVRNLIAMDAAFMDYVFVSKSTEKAAHISPSLNYNAGREALFHELGCLLDLIQQKFGLTVTQPAAVLTT